VVILLSRQLLSRAHTTSTARPKLTPPNDAGLDRLPRCPIPPLPTDALTREWKDVGPNMIFGQSLYLKTSAWIFIGHEAL
jgi:hypothetical protein